MATNSAHIMNTHQYHCRDLCLGRRWARRRSCRGSSCWGTPGSPRAAWCRRSCTGCSCSSSCCGSGSGSCYTPSPPGTAAARRRLSGSLLINLQYYTSVKVLLTRHKTPSMSILNIVIVINILTSGSSYTLTSVEKSHRLDSRSTIFFTVLAKA